MEKGGSIRFGIGKKLLFYFLLLSLVPIIVGGTIAFTIARNQLEKNTKAHLSDLARDCGRKITFYMNSRYQDIKILSQAEVLKGSEKEAKQNYIDEVISVYPYYKAISVLDLNGTIKACTRRDLIGESRADTTWFQKTRQAAQGEVVPLDAYRAETAGFEMVVGFNTPITDKDKKKVIGVLATRVNMDHIIARVRLLDERTISDHHAYLLNGRGEIIAGPEEKEFLTVHRLYDFPVVKNLLAGKTGISEYINDRGEDVISARYALQGDGSFDGWGWGVLVTMPVSEAFRAAYEIRDKIILLALIIAFLVTVFALFISKKVSRPITEVSKSASVISQGNLEPIKIDYGSKDEIGDLVSVFNKMTEDLHKTTVSRDSLAKEIIERKKAEDQIKTLSRQIIDIQEKERESLSREIHDNIGQLLATLKMGIFRMNKKIPDKLSALKEELSELVYLVNKTIREIRGLSHALHPPVIEDLGLSSALEELCQDFKSYSEIRIDWNFEPIEKPLQSVHNIMIYRLIQEGLHNILKHSKATEVDVSLTISDNKIEITIDDNGIGFVVDDVLSSMPKKKALGLISMRERFALIGGVLQINSEIGKGTKIIASLEME